MAAAQERWTYVINGMERKAATGKWTGGTHPYGYRIDPHTHHLIPDPSQAPIVEQIFTLYADTRKGRRPSWSAPGPASMWPGPGTCISS